MRLPNIDDRAYVLPTSADFALKTQTSEDVEAGLRGKWGKFSGQTSAFLMRLRHEIDYDPGANGGFGANVNLDPTERKGVENEASYAISDAVRLKGSLTYTDAKFRQGLYADRKVPLVSPWTGSTGLSWDAWQKYAVLDTDLRYASSRRLGDDFTNTAPRIPAHTLVDLKLSGEVERINWSVAVQNLFDVRYYEEGFASSFTPGTYSAYPMPGRTYMAHLGVTF
jgi:iron complex outermembrane receptor protein